MSTARKDLLALFILSIIVAAFLFDGVILHHVLQVSSAGVDYWSHTQWAARIYGAHHIPPWHADSRGAYYPLNLAFIFFGPGAAQYILLLHFFLTTVFVYFWMRRLGVRSLAAVLSACALVFSGPYVSFMHDPYRLISLTWFPLVLLFSHFAYRRNDVRLAALTGLFLGIQFLSGEVRFFFVSVIAVVLWTLILFGRFLPRLLLTTVMVCFGVACIQLIPLLAYGSAHAVETLTWLWGPRAADLPAWRLLELLFPNLFGIGIQGEEFWRHDLYGGASPLLWGLNAGVLPLCLAAVGIVLRRKPFDRVDRFLMILAVAGLAAAFWDESFFIFSILGLAVGCGLGLDRLLTFCVEWESQNRETRRRLNQVLIGIFILAAVIWALWLLVLTRQQDFGSWLLRLTSATGNPAGEDILQAGLRATMVLTASAILIWKRLKVRGDDAFFALLVLALAVWELFEASGPLLRFADSGRHPGFAVWVPAQAGFAANPFIADLGKYTTFAALTALAVYLLHPFSWRMLWRAFTLDGLRRQ